MAVEPDAAEGLLAELRSRAVDARAIGEFTARLGRIEVV
jgi:hydrogenase maturation factor